MIIKMKRIGKIKEKTGPFVFLQGAARTRIVPVGQALFLSDYLNWLNAFIKINIYNIRFLKAPLSYYTHLPLEANEWTLGSIQLLWRSLEFLAEFGHEITALLIIFF